MSNSWIKKFLSSNSYALRAICLCVLGVIGVTSAFAEGSKELNANGGDRAYLNSTSIANPSNPFPTLGTIKVYVRSGETLYLGSSAMGIGNGNIVVRTPSGAAVPPPGIGEGFIANRTQEVAGPFTVSNPTGYIPYIVPVNETGVWEIDFLSPDYDNTLPGGNTNPPAIAANGNWAQNTNTTYISAFDVSVRNIANTAFVTGRAYMNIFNGYLAEFDATFEPIFKIITKDGYQYDVDNNGQAGNGFAFFVNNKGFRNGANAASYQSVNSSTNPPVQDPRSVDSGTDITHKIFFNTPDSDPVTGLPTSAPTPGGGSTWLLNTPVSPTVTTFTFTGKEGTPNVAGTSNSLAAAMGGNIGFITNQAGSYVINIDINGDGDFLDPVDRRLTGSAVSGANSIPWDGLNGQGAKVTGTVNFSPGSMQVILRAGEVHFPFMDVENNPSGMIIKRTNGVGAPNDVVYWDDSNIGGGTKSPVIGSSSTANGHKWGNNSYDGNAFGNERGLDTWTYVESSPTSSSMSIAMKEANLEVVSITRSKNSLCVGEQQTYTIVVRNNGPSDITGAKFRFAFPSQFTGVIGSWSDGSTGSVSIPDSWYEATIDLNSLEVLTFTVSGTVASLPAGNTLPVTASILRPADVNDPDATNTDPAAPADPLAECDSAPSGLGCNNVKTNSTAVVSPNITIANATVTEGSSLGITNMNFVVSLSAANPACATTVTYNITDTDTNSADFAGSTSGTVTIPANAISANISIPINADKKIEKNETFKVTISGATSGQITVADALGTITDDDNAPIVIQAKTNGSEPASPGEFVVKFPAGVSSSVPTTVTYSIAGSATAGTDYTTLTGTVIIPADIEEWPISVSVLDDKLIEGPETVSLTLSGASSTIPATVTPGTATITIADDDVAQNTITLTKVADGEEPGTPGRFRFSFPAGVTSTAPTTITYLIGGTATNGADYGALTGSVVIPTGLEFADINVVVSDDLIIEGDETVTLSNIVATNSLGFPFAYSGVPASLTIKDNDNLNPSITVTATSASEPGSNGRFRFSLPVGMTSTVPTVITYNVLPGSTATNGVDYSNLTGTVTIPAGANFADAVVTVIDDKIIEGAERIDISVTSAVNTVAPGLTFSAGPYIVGINDDDNTTPNNVITLSKVTDGAEPGTAIRYRVSYPLGVTSSALSTISYSVGGTATNGADFVTPSGTVDILPGANEAFIDIPVINDNISEATETLTLTITSATNSVSALNFIANNPVSASIFDDENIGPNNIITLYKINDGAEPATNALFRVKFPGAIVSAAPTTVTYSITGTAVNGTDYSTITGSVVIPANVNFVDIPVSIIDDKIIEGTETIALQLTAAVNTISPTLTVNPGTVVADLVDDDNSTPNNIITLTRVQDGFEGGTQARFKVSFPAGITSSTASVVSYSVSGTAINGTDYGTLTGTVTIPAGSGSAFIDLPVVDDLIIEGTESVSLILTNAANSVALLSVAPSTAVSVDIIDNDNNSPNVALTLVRDGAEGGINPQYRVSFPLNVTSSVDTRLNYFISGTATNGVDYNVLSGTVTIPAGSNFADIDVLVDDDLIIEGNEAVALTLTGVSNAVSPSMTYSPGTAISATIADNDNAAPNNIVTLTLDRHGKEGGNSARFKVAFPVGVTSSGATLVTYAIGGTAVNIVDYAQLTGSVTIPAGANSAFIDAPVVDDFIIEGNEMLALTLLSANTSCSCPLTVQPGAAVIANIEDNEDLNSTITLTKIQDGAEPGTKAQFMVSLPSGITSSASTTVNYLLGGTAVNGTDYQTLTGSVVIPAGASSAVIDVNVTDDFIIEGDETVTVRLTSATNPIPASAFTVSPSAAVTALIIDNDNTTPNNVVTATRFQSGAEPGTNVIFRVSFPSVPNITSSAPTLVSYNLAGTALAGTDYGFLPGTIIIPAGANYADIVVPVIDDKIIEGVETVDLTLNWATNPVAGLIVQPTTVVSADIADDDVVPPSSVVTLSVVNDGSEPATYGQFKVSFPPGVTSSVATVLTYSVAPGAPGVASPGSDYEALTGTVTIPANANYALIDVLVNDDLIIEGTETVSLTLTSATNAVASNIQRAPLGPVTLNILDDEEDPANPANVITLTRVSNGTEPGTSAYFKVSYPPGVTASAATDVIYSVAPVAPGVAIPNTDYEALSGTITIPSGANSAIIEVKVKDDQIIEFAETVSLQLSSANRGGTALTVSPASPVTAYIDDDDNVPPYNVISVKRSQNASEPASDGAFEVGFPDGYTSSELTTVFYTLGGTAANGTDYVAVSGSVQILPNTNSAINLIDVKDDLIIEGDETVTLTITGATNAISNPQILPGIGSITIGDDDNTATNNTISLSRISNGTEPSSDPQFRVSFPSGVTTTSDTYVSYSVGGTATNGVDYTTITGVAVIPAGQTSADIVIDVIDDKIIEGTENVILTLTSAGNALVNTLAVSNAPVDADIADDDNTGQLELVREQHGTEPGTNARFKVEYPGGATRSIESVIGYIITGTASPDTDYRALTGTVRIPAGDKFAYIDAEVLDDQIIEPTETVTIKLNSINSTATNTISLDPTAETANILDDDFTGASVILTKVSDGAEPGTNAVFRVAYNNGRSASLPTVITYSSAGGTATGGLDYVPLTHTITIPADKNFVEFPVTVLNDDLIEPTELISLQLLTANNTIQPITVPATVVTANIYDDDILSKITIKHVDDGAEPNDNGLFRIGFEGAVTSGVNTTVNYVISGTATNGTDYTAISGTTVILAGQNYRDVDVLVQDDKIIEGTESVVLSIISATSSIVNPDIVDGTKTVNILDDDSTPLNNTVTLERVAHGAEPGTNAQFRVRLPNVPSVLSTTSDTRINYTIGGTATNGLDYDVLNGIAIIPAGQNSALIDVIVKDDKTIEGIETVKLTLVSAHNDLIPALNVEPGTAVSANIIDDDNIAPFTILSLSKEADAQEPSTPGRIKVAFPTGYSSSMPTEVSYSVAGTALHNVDYQTLSGKVIIPADENSAYIDINVIDDQKVEGNETVEIAVTGIVNAAVPALLTVSPASVIANIRDDDYATLTISSPVTTVEGDGGPTTATFTVTLSKETQEGFQLLYNTADGTASASAGENDYDSASGKIILFNPGQLSKTFTITINGDKVIERDEDYQVIFDDLADDLNGHLSFSNKTATGIIQDDDNTIANKKITITKSDGTEGGPNAHFTFSFPPGVSADVPTTISYTLTGTAQGQLATDEDYTTSNLGSITIPAKANFFQTDLIVNDDALIELTETVIVNAGIPVNTRYADIVVDNTPLSLNIFDNDNATLSISGPLTITEGDLGQKILNFAVTLNQATEQPFDISFKTKDGTATVLDHDYAAASGTLSFGSTAPLTQNISVIVYSDKKIESNENFTVELSSPSGNPILGGLVQIAGSPAQGIIQDDDNTIANKKISIVAINGAEGGFNASVTFKFPDGVSTDGTTTIPYTFAGSAIGSGIDYNVPQSSSITIPADSNKVTIPLIINDDNLIEGDELVVVTANPVSNDKYAGLAIDNAPQTLTIVDNDDALISISAPAAVTEGDGVPTTMNFTVSLNKPTEHGFQVDYNTLDGTALSPADYDAASGQLHFAAGELSKTITITVRGDKVIERDEQFQVQLSNITPAFGGHLSFSNTTATGLIIDDDNTAANKKITIAKTDGMEGATDGLFTFSFPAGVSADAATVISYTLTGTAKSGSAADKDYSNLSTGSVTIPAGETSVSLLIDVEDDPLTELTETVIINADLPQNSRYNGIVIDNNGLSLNINDNDNATLSISGPVTFDEGDLGQKIYTFNVTLNKAVEDAFDVNYNTKNGTATILDQDYAASNGTLSFGGTSPLTKTIEVVVYGDKKIESDENFTVELSTLLNSPILGGRVVIAAATAQGIIKDDDNIPPNKQITITTINGAEGGTDASVTFSLPAGVSTDGITSIPYTLAGSALGGGVDYNSASTATVVIPAGGNSVTISLPVVDDALIETTENVIVNTSAISNDKYSGFATSNAPQTLNIADNDGSTLSISGPVSIGEGDNGSKKVVFDVKLNAALGSGFTVRYNTADGSAQAADNDYVPVTNGQLTFQGLAGEVKQIEISVIGDRKIERNEDFQVILTGLSNNFNGQLLFDNTTAMATIVDDDNIAVNKDITIVKTDGTEGAANGSFTFKFPPGVSSDVPTTIEYTLDGTAKGAGIDYNNAQIGQAVIFAGQNFVNVTINVVNDVNLEADETVILTTGAVTNNSYPGIKVLNSPVTLVIEDNDNASLTVNAPAAVNEGNTATRNITFRVTLSNGTGEPFTVNYKTKDGTASLGDNDYVQTSGTLTFSGTTGEFKTISVPVNGDLKIEKNEDFFLELDGISNDFDGRLVLSGAPAVGTINDDDNTAANKRITITKVDGAEGGAEGRFKFSFPSGITADDWTSINYVLGGSASANDHTAPSTGTLTIPAGQNSVILPVPVVDDQIIEGTEAVLINTGLIENNSYTGITVASTSVSLNITDNDSGELRLSGPIVVTEGNGGPTLATFTVTLTHGTGAPFAIGYTTMDGTARAADNDYFAKSGNLSFTGDQGEVQTLTILVNGDFKIESDEEFNVVLRNLSNNFGGRLVFSSVPSKGRILNDDNGPITITKIDGKEGAAGGSFTFSLPPNVFIDKPIVIPYNLSGTALGNDIDYLVSSSGSVTIPAGLNKVTLNLVIKDDAIIEPTETVKITTGIALSPVPDAILVVNSPQELVILDNDTAPIVVTNPVITKEGHNGLVTATFDATLPLATATGFTLDFATTDGTAKVSDNDYLSNSGRLTFAGSAGEVQKIKVQLKGDVRVEGDEDYFVRLTNLSNNFENRLTLKFNEVKGVIHDDDNAPIALDDSIATDEDVPVSLSLVNNDTDIEGIDVTSITVKTQPLKGTVKVNRDGSILYTPARDDNGTRSFIYTVKDITGLESNEARVTIIIRPVNDPPLALDDRFFVHRDSTLRQIVSLNDSDPDADELRFNVLSQPKKGVLRSFSEADGAFIYTPTDTTFKGFDQFSYRVTDPEGLTEDAVVTLEIQPGVRVKLTPSVAKIREGDAIAITAELSESLLQDVDIFLDFAGTAKVDSDYVLSGNYVTMRIDSGQTGTSQSFKITAKKDYLKEGDEIADVSISSVLPQNFVTIESGSVITISEVNPQDKPAGPKENGDIAADPYTSPDGDGLGNDSFVINNIDKYPDNEVVIFNRWGNEVFRIKGYNNKDKAFSGVANSGLFVNKNVTLPEGVYYFIIYTKVDNVMKLNKGYVIVRR